MHEQVGKLLRLGHDRVSDISPDVLQTLHLVPHFVSRFLLEAPLLQVPQLLVVVFQFSLQLTNGLSRFLVLLFKEEFHSELLLSVRVGAQLQELVDVLVPARLLQPETRQDWLRPVSGI